MTPVDPTPPSGDVRPGRRLYVGMLAVGAVGLLYLGVAPEHWLRGVLILSAGLLLGGISRLVLPNGRAGPLAVRGKPFDVVCYVLASAAVAGFGFIVR